MELIEYKPNGKYVRRTELARKLATLRVQTGLSQAKVAKEIGIKQAALGNYESGFRRPNLGALKLLAEYYGVTVDYLIGDEQRDDDLSPNTRALLQAVKGASEEELAQYIRVIEALRRPT